MFIFILGENNKQQEHDEENSCSITDIYVQPLSTEPAHQSEGITSSEFELGIATFPNNRQIALDSPIKVPKVTEDFSQDSFPQLSIKGMNIYIPMPN